MENWLSGHLSQRVAFEVQRTAKVVMECFAAVAQQHLAVHNAADPGKPLVEKRTAVEAAVVLATGTAAVAVADLEDKPAAAELVAEQKPLVAEPGLAELAPVELELAPVELELVEPAELELVEPAELELADRCKLGCRR